MELNLQKQTITINEVVLAESVEQPIECDAMLPDYQPDIAKILKCAVSVNIGSTGASDKTLSIEGMAVIHVYYLSESEGIRRCEYKVPFTKNTEMPRAAMSPVVMVRPSVDYVNCRAVSGRRLDVRGAVTLEVKVTERGSEEVISGAEGGGLQLRQQMVKSTELSGQCESIFSVAEDLEVAYGKPPIATILRTDCRVNVQECKVVSGKVVAKADLMVHITYLPQGDCFQLEMMDYTLPISQIIDADGVDENCICDVMMHVMSCDVQPRADEAGEYRMLTLEARMKAVVAVHRQQEIPVASDCYSTDYDCTCKQRPVSFLYLEKILRETIMHRDSLELPEGVSEVMDVWCEVETSDWKQDNEEIVINLRLTVCMFARVDGSEGILYFEQTSDLSQRVPVSCTEGKIMLDPTCDVLSCSYGLSGDKMDIRVEIIVRGCVYCCFRQNSVAEITLDEAAPRSKKQNRLCLYYADKDESIWDIAKRYHTSANAIWEENNIQNDLLTVRCMLLIPMV